MKKCFILILIASVILPIGGFSQTPNPAQPQKRIALVFGNSDYVNGIRLKNPVNDADLMEAHLKNLGFKVIKQLNAGRDSMIKSI